MGPWSRKVQPFFCGNAHYLTEKYDLFDIFEILEVDDDHDS